MEPRGIRGMASVLGTRKFWLDLAVDAAFMGGLLLVILGLLYAYSGVWPPMVTVDGQSMLPNLKPDDLIIVQGLDRVGITTYADSIAGSYRTFGDFGDVIVYRPMGDSRQTPVIHRAMYYVEEGQPMWPGGPIAPHAGYITQGDNNYMYDQAGPICLDQPVKKEWIMGVSRFRIPYLGKVRSILNLK